MTSGQTFRKHHRLLKRAQFRHTERKGHRRAGKHLVVVARRNEVDFSRLGITVTRKVGNAVVRNRWKRRLREVFRQNRQRIPEGWDFVVIVRRGVEIEPAFEIIAEELLYLSRAVASPRDPR